MSAAGVIDETVVDLVTSPSVQVMGSPRVVAESVIELLQRAGHQVSAQPDVVVLVDPDDADWAALSSIGCPAVLLHSAVMSDAHVVTAVTRGVGALVRIDEVEPDLLVALVAQVAAGDIVLDPQQRVAVVSALRNHYLVTVTLTVRELDILNCVEEGRSVKQTARELGISPKTVENTQRHLFKKLGVRNRSQAVARAHALGLLAGSS